MENKEYSIDYEHSKMLARCEDLCNTFKHENYKVIRHINTRINNRKKFIKDFVSINPDIDWFALQFYFFPALFDNFNTKTINVGQQIVVRNSCLESFVNLFLEKKIDYDALNKVVQVLGQTPEAFARLPKDTYDKLLADNKNNFSLFDSIIVNKLFMIENIEDVIEKVAKTDEFIGTPSYNFVRAFNKFSGEYAVRYNGHLDYIVYLLNQMPNYNPNNVGDGKTLNELDPHQKEMRIQIRENLSHVSEIEITNNPGKHMYIDTRCTFDYSGNGKSNAANDIINYVIDGITPAEERRLDMEIVLPEGITPKYVVAGNYCAVIDAFEITPERIQEKLDKCNELILEDQRERELFEKRFK